MSLARAFREAAQRLSQIGYVQSFTAVLQLGTNQCTQLRDTSPVCLSAHLLVDVSKLFFVGHFLTVYSRLSKTDRRCIFEQATNTTL